MLNVPTQYCYECNCVVPYGQLSPRSRCVLCEYKRSRANEKENDELRVEIERLKSLRENSSG